MTLPALMLLLAYPALWEAKTDSPQAICQVDGTICLWKLHGEMVLAMGLDGQDLLVLHDAPARVAWNEATLRSWDWKALQRDRQSRVGK